MSSALYNINQENCNKGCDKSCDESYKEICDESYDKDYKENHDEKIMTINWYRNFLLYPDIWTEISYYLTIEEAYNFWRNIIQKWPKWTDENLCQRCLLCISECILECISECIPECILECIPECISECIPECIPAYSKPLCKCPDFETVIKKSKQECDNKITLRNNIAYCNHPLSDDYLKCKRIKGFAISKYFGDHEIPLEYLKLENAFGKIFIRKSATFL